MTLELSWKSCGKLLAKSSRPEKFHKCSKSIPKGPLVERCDNECGMRPKGIQRKLQIQVELEIQQRILARR
jgi:hypothetical protein